MTLDATGSHQSDLTGISWRAWCCRGWELVLQFALVLWVDRVPLAMTALGWLLLGLAPQAQDLFVEFAHNPWRIPLFLLFLVFAWAMPTHYSARLLLDTDARFQDIVASQQAIGRARWIELIERGFPRFLGLSTFAAVLIAIWRSHINLPIFSEPDDQEAVQATNQVLGWLAVCVFVTAIGFFIYTIKRPRNADMVGLRELKDFNRRLAPLWRRISPGLQLPDGDADASRNLGRLLLAGVFVAFVGIFLLGADVAARFAPRSMAVPFILGGWLPFLSFLSGAGRQCRAPLILGLFVLVSLLTVVLGDNHSVRLINASKTAGHSIDLSVIPLQDAVSLWMRENQCEAAPAACPRPIVIAAAGGASRAGFFMASIIGYLMQDAPKHGLDANQVRNRLFAISGVSGGAMGAVMVTAALDARPNSEGQPCVQSSFRLWWGERINNWRDCFEALTSGDFISADFFAFAFNDMLPFGPWRDRAAVLEGTWNDRYRAVITPPNGSVSPPCEGLGCPFLSLRPREGHWIPLLVLNGTSEATGGRIVTTPLASTYRATLSCPTSQNASDCRLFVDADRFHDLLNYRARPTSWLGAFQRAVSGWKAGSAVVDDVRLDTAALNSARFPFISPAGSVRNKNLAIVDRIVDGGYFENYGALSAKEIALAIHAAQPALAPVVVVVSNDPNDFLNLDEDAVGPEAKVKVKADLQNQRDLQEKKARTAVNGDELVTDIVTPLITVANTRTAHGILGVDQTRSTLREAMSNCQPQAFLIPVRVWPQHLETGKGSREVSMSWWLSTLIQRHLHQQTELAATGTGKNSNQNEPWLKAIWNVMRSTSGCETP
jgi:hypothetical protein